MRTFNELWGQCTPNSWARVPRGPVAVAVGTFLFGTTATAFTVGAAAVTWGTIGGFLITTAVTTWALSALAPRPEVPVRNSLGNIKEATGPFDIVYGEVRKGGVITFLETTDRIGYKVFKDDYLHMVIVLAGHEVEEIGDIYLNDEKVTLNSSGFVTSGRWAEISQVVRIKKHLGSPNQLADPDLVAETSADENFRGRGIAYLYVRMDWDKDVFSSGTPTITAMVKGKKCFDPRTNTTAWTDNSALCIRDYLSEEYGANSKQSPSSLQSPSWNTGANVCDISVPLNGGGSEKRYTMNGILSTANSPRANLQKMLTTCGGTLFWGQGQWQFKAGYLPAGPYVSFNADDLRSGIDLVTKNSRRENFNSVTGVFTNKNQDYIEMEYPRINSAVFLARDNGQTNTLDMPLPFTVSPAAAQRLAKMALFRSREEIIIGADFGLKAANVKVGDVVQFTFSRYGFVNKLFEVITWKPVVDGGELKINLVLKETSAAAYSWTAEESQIIGRDTTLPNPTAGLTITGLTVTNRQTLQSDGTLLGEVVLSWNGAETAFLSRYNVQWKRTTDVNWSATTTEEESIILPSVRTGVPYAFRVQAVNVAGFAGPWEQIGATLPGKNTPPGVPTSFTATNRYRAAELNWTNPTDPDLNRVEIYTNTTNSTTGVTKVGESGGTKFIYDMEPMQSRWFFLRAVDHSGNRSAFTPGRQATALFIETNDVDLDVPQLLDDAGLAAVEVLSALPTTGNFVGRTVYLTTDQQLYVWNGTAWVKSVKTGEDILTEFNFPNNLRPIEVVNALPTTGNFVGRMVFLTTDNKMYRRTATGWTAAVPSTDITGQLTNSQIAAIDAAKVSGQLTDSQIAAISTAKLQGTITTTQIGNNSITTGKIATNAVTANEIASGTIVADNIAANAIISSKISANAITSREIATETIIAGNIASNAVTTAKINAGAVTANEIGANAVIAGKIAANAVTAGTIEAGAVTADKIRANSIGASKLYVTDFSNLIPDSDIIDADAWTNQNPSQYIIGTSGSSFKSTNWVRSPLTSGSNSGSFASKQFSLETGQEYFASIQARSNGADQNVELFARVNLENQDGSTNSSVTIRGTSQGAIPSSATTYTASFVVPSGVVAGRLRWSFSETSSGTAYVGGPSLRRKNGGELIVDGAISAIHMSANSVTAGVISAGAVNAAAIATNAVTADKINVNTLSAISANLGSITAGSISIGPAGEPANFIVTNNGNVTIRSGTAGERLVISNNQINVFDATGTLRVRIGQL